MDTRTGATTSREDNGPSNLKPKVRSTYEILMEEGPLGPTTQEDLERARQRIAEREARAKRQATMDKFRKP